MLFALTSVFGKRRKAPPVPPSQLALEFDAAAPIAPPTPQNADELLARLRTLGLRRIERCRLTRNRNVMVSYRGRDLRVHQGYLAAPESVHRAIVRFVEGRTRADRRGAQREILSFKIEMPVREPRRREVTRPEDEPISATLVEWHARFNAEHFGGALKVVPVRISRRMKSRLGHYSAARGSQPGEIAISWRHLRRHGWSEALQTLLHEMVHQWQDETGRPLDHGPGFRAKAREVGITASAKRAPGP
jgi:hypothetical protein